jgi:DHA1 family inner membrane transport protein
MKNEKILLLILAIVQFTHIIDFMIIMPLGAQFMDLFDISPQQFSLIVSSYAFSAFIFGLFSALFIDRFDRKRALLFIYAGFTIGTFACAFSPTYEVFLLTRSLTGAFGGVLSAMVLSIVGDAVPLERRGRAMGWVMTAFSAASVVGVPAGIYLAAVFSWRMPFLVVAGMAALMLLLIVYWVPPLRGHFRSDGTRLSPLAVLQAIWTDPNQLRALLFTTVLMLGHFTIIPFIAPYMQINVGFSDIQVTYIYLVGGSLTVFLLPIFGRLSDRYGHARVFTIASVLALGSIYAITNLPEVPLVMALCVTSSFFVVASGRNVPATTMVTSVVNPEQRASFLSIRSSANEAALALGSFIAGSIVTKNDDGALENYMYVGYFAMLMSVLAVFVARKLRTVS